MSGFYAVMVINLTNTQFGDIIHFTSEEFSLALSCFVVQRYKRGTYGNTNYNVHAYVAYIKVQQCSLAEECLLEAGQGLSEHVARVTDLREGVLADGWVDTTEIPRLNNQHQFTAMQDERRNCKSEEYIGTYSVVYECEKERKREGEDGEGGGRESV